MFRCFVQVCDGFVEGFGCWLDCAGMLLISQIRFLRTPVNPPDAYPSPVSSRAPFSGRFALLFKVRFFQTFFPEQRRSNFFGKQTHIPKPIALDYDRSNESSALMPAPNLSYENSDISTPPKKARLDRKVRL